MSVKAYLSCAAACAAAGRLLLTAGAPGKAKALAAKKALL
jgi:hypothetical protein